MERQDANGLGSFETRKAGCLEQFSKDLLEFYRDESELGHRQGVRRFLADDRSSGESCLIHVSTYNRPLSPQGRDWQEQIVASMAESPVAKACEVNRYRLDDCGHYISSELADSVSLYQILRQRRQLNPEDVFYILSEIADGIEIATAEHWPRLDLDLQSLFLTKDDNAPTILIVPPPLPGPEAIAQARCIPTHSGIYIQQLAALACSLLGMGLRSGGFRPIAELGANRNHLLKLVIDSDFGRAFSSASDFAHSLENQKVPKVDQGMVDITYFSPSAQTNGDLLTVRQAPSESPELSSNEQARALIDLLPVAKDSVSEPLTVVRLVPEEKERGAATICVTDTLSVGRSSAAEFVTQFSPRSSKNDQLTRLISRKQLQFRLSNGEIICSESESSNTSFVCGKPMAAKVKIAKDSRIMLAGEYELNLQFSPSSWSNGQVWNKVISDIKLSGGLLLSPGKPGISLDNQTAWVFTDVMFGLDVNDQLRIAPRKRNEVLGAFLRADCSLFVVALEEEGSIYLDGKSLRLECPALLSKGLILKIGSYQWTIG